MSKKPQTQNNRSSQQQGGKNAPAVQKQSREVAIPDEMQKMMEQDSGKGVSTHIDDNVVPLVYLLQALSKPCVKKTPEYIEGAEPGMAWFRGTKTVVACDKDDAEGLLVQPVFFNRCVIEWRPDRGGFVARHNVDNAKDVAGARQIEHPKKPGQMKWISRDGNDLVETREHVVLVHDVFDKPTPFVIPMSGTNHAASRNWMSLMNRKTIPGTDKKAASFAYLYRLKTEQRNDGQNTWYVWTAEDGGGDGEPMLATDVEIYKYARQLEADFASGKKRADVVDDLETDGGAGDGGGEI